MPDAEARPWPERGLGMTWSVRVIPSRYVDSVRLMGVAQGVRERAGVDAREVAMGTAANLEALAALGVGPRRGRPDVVIAVDAATTARAAGRCDAPRPRGRRPARPRRAAHRRRRGRSGRAPRAGRERRADLGAGRVRRRSRRIER